MHNTVRWPLEDVVNQVGSKARGCRSDVTDMHPCDARTSRYLVVSSAFSRLDHLYPKRSLDELLPIHLLKAYKSA